MSGRIREFTRKDPELNRKLVQLENSVFSLFETAKNAHGFEVRPDISKPGEIIRPGQLARAVKPVEVLLAPPTPNSAGFPLGFWNKSGGLLTLRPVKGLIDGAESKTVIADQLYFICHDGVDFTTTDDRREALDVTRFGARGDGVADDTKAIQKALDAAKLRGGGRVFFPPGTYRITGDLFWYSGTYLVGAGMYTAVLDFSTKAAFNYDNGMLRLTGAGRSNAQSVTASVARGALSSTVASAAGYASGDIVQLRSTETYVIADGGTRAEFLRVRYVSGNTVYFTTPTIEPYDTGLGTVQLANISFATGGVSDLSIRGKGVNPLGVPTPDQYTSTAEINDASQNTRGDYGIECIWGRDLTFKNLRFYDVENQPIAFQSCYGVDVENCRFEFSAIQVRSQYAVALYRCTSDVRITDCFSINNRHFVTTGSTSSTGSDHYFGVPHNVTIKGNVVLGSWQAGIDTHRSGFNFTITGNVLQCYYTGIKVRARGAVVTGNVCYGPNATDAQANYDGIQAFFNCSDLLIEGNQIFGHACGIRLATLDADAENVTIRGNQIRDCGAYGIRVTATTFTMRRLKIEGNLVDSPAFYGVFVDGNFEDVSVCKNTLNGGSYGVRTSATGTRSGFVVSDNVARGAVNDSFYLETVTGLTCNGNHAYGANTNGVHIRIQDCKRGTVVGNHVKFPASSTGGNGIYINATGDGTCQDLAIASNQVWAPSAVGTGIAFDNQLNQFHTVAEDNNCRTCATPVAATAEVTIRNQVFQRQSSTIATGAITANHGIKVIIVDTEAAAAADDLDTISYTGREGDELSVRINSGARIVTLKDNTGNLRLNGDYAVPNVDSRIKLVWGGSTWSEVSRSTN
jgi:hypothetical protein